jgi:hypothetical protein
MRRQRRGRSTLLVSRFLSNYQFRLSQQQPAAPQCLEHHQGLQRSEEWDAMPQTGTARTVRFVLRSGALVVLLFFLSTVSCRNTERTWSAEAKSPDGRYVVTAETLRPGGWGTGAPAQTTVDLNYTSGHQGSAEIFTFVGGPDEPDGMNVGIKWLSPTQLELTYKGNPTIEFQAMKCRGVDISSREADNRPAR